MRKHKYIVLILLVLLVAIPTIAFAQFGGFLSLPMGGKVITTPTDTSAVVTCPAGYGPFMIQPVNLAPPGPYYISATALIFSGIPKRNGYILGLYSPIPNTTSCFNTETGAPIPVLTLKPYGISKGLF